jgi:phosphopantothenoylcysteine synthetase/decarboxylase
MRCIVTAGPTYEPLDQIRRLTNFSTGRLGSELVNHLANQGHEVLLLIGQHATYRGERKAQQVETFTTTENLAERLRSHRNETVDAVFHAAAVNDFAFGKTWRRGEDGKLVEVRAGKFSTRDGTLLAELVPTSKIISELRDWYPNALLVGWKFEVDGGRSSLLELAREQLERCRTDACVMNGPALGVGFGVLRPGGSFEECLTAGALFEVLGRLVSASAT